MQEKTWRNFRRAQKNLQFLNFLWSWWAALIAAYSFCATNYAKVASHTYKDENIWSIFPFVSHLSWGEGREGGCTYAFFALLDFDVFGPRWFSRLHKKRSLGFRSCFDQLFMNQCLGEMRGNWSKAPLMWWQWPESKVLSSTPFRLRHLWRR